MRRARASYHYGIRRIRNEEDEIVRRRMAESLSGADGRNFRKEVRKIRHSKANSSGIVDGCELWDLWNKNIDAVCVDGGKL